MGVMDIKDNPVNEKVTIDLSHYYELVEKARVMMNEESKKVARLYVPQMFEELHANQRLSPEAARKQIEYDCKDMWAIDTILEHLPEEAKNAEKRKAALASVEARKSKALTTKDMSIVMNHYTHAQLMHAYLESLPSGDYKININKRRQFLNAEPIRKPDRNISAPGIEKTVSAAPIRSA